MEIKLGNKTISKSSPTYFIADIAANHDGSLARAIKLINLAKESGADAVKFQHHNVAKYVSDFGFKRLGGKLSHQKKWKKSIFEVYKDAEVPRKWTKTLVGHCRKINIKFMSTPYDLDTVDYLDKFLPAFKIGSGDLAWDDMIKKILSKKKPFFLATGASTLSEVDHAVKIITAKKISFCLMQCNTNYTGSIENFKYINLKVLNVYKKKFPNILLGLSDHTPGHETVLGSIMLGAKVIEKHFTDDTKRPGPDHPFSMDPRTWRLMIDSSRNLENALGDGIKKVEKNEIKTVVLQRRATRAIKDLKKGQKITREDVEYQRPCPLKAITPNASKKIFGKKVKRNIKSGDFLRKNDFNI
jgi:sialic acid synthase SpsE|tara:strand:- start:659 stop:1726 length:1068 start_codon:yes stop_codon:yes gene_type:complete